MGNPQSRSAGQLKQGVEILSASDTKLGIKSLSEAAKKLSKDPNIETADKIKNLDGRLDRMTQLDEISAMTAGLVSAMAKLGKKGGDLNKLSGRPDLLKQELMDKGVIPSLELSERTAIEHFSIILGQSGDTADYFRKSWSNIVEQAKESSKGWTEKVRNYVKKDPVKAIGMLAIGAFGVWAGWSLIKKLWKDKKESGGSSSKEGGKSWMSAKVIVPIGLMIAGAIIGRNKLKQLMGGLDIDKIQNLLKKGEAIPADLRKQMEEQAKKIEELEKAAKAKTAAGVAAVTSTVSGIADKTKSGTPGAKDILSKASEKASDPGKQFQTARLAFIKLFFHQRAFHESSARRDLGIVISELQDMPIKNLEDIFNKYKDDSNKTVPRDKFGTIKKDISNKKLYLLISHLLTLKKVIGEPKQSENVRDLLIRALNDPINKISNVFNANILENAKNSNNPLSVIADLDFKKMNESIIQSADTFINSVNEKLKIKISEEKKPTLTEIQIYLFTNATLGETAQSAVARAIQDNNLGNKADAEVIRVAEDFFNKIKSATETTLPNLRDKFAIKGADGTNMLDQYMVSENLSFHTAIQLLVINESAITEIKQEKARHWSKDLAMFYVILQALPPSARSKYLGVLIQKFATDDTDFFEKIKGLKSLLPYLNSLKEVLLDKVLGYGIDVINLATPWMETPSEEQIKGNTIISMGSQTLGGALELTGDALAIIISLGIDAKTLGSTETAEEFIDLIATKGGTIHYDKDNPKLLAVKVGANWTVMKPVGKMVDVLKEIAEGDASGAVSTYLVAGANFAVIGGIREAILNRREASVAYNLLKGSAKMTVGWAGIWAKDAFNVGERAVYYAKKPKIIGEEVFRWGADRLKYNPLKKGLSKGTLFPGQNVTNLLKSGERFLAQHKLSSEYSNMTKGRVAEEILDTKGKAILTSGRRWLTSNFHTNKAIAEGSIFAKRYIDFFKFARRESPISFRYDVLSKNRKKLDDVEVAVERLRGLMVKLNKNNGKILNEVSNEVNRLIKAGYKKDDIARNMREFLTTKNLELSPNEYTAISRQLTSERKVGIFTEKITNGVSKMPKGSEVTKGVKAISNAPDVKKVVALGDKVDDVLKSANDDLGRVKNKVTEATGKLAKAKKSGRGVEKAEEVLTAAKKAEADLRKGIKNLEEIKDIQRQIDNTKKTKKMARKMAKLKQKLEAIKKVAAKNLDIAQESTQSVTKSSRLAVFGKFTGKIGSKLRQAGDRVGEVASKVPEKLKPLTEKLLRRSNSAKAAEKAAERVALKVVDDVGVALKNAMSDLKSVSNKVKQARIDLNLAKRSDQGPTVLGKKIAFNAEESIDKAKQVLRQAEDAKSRVSTYVGHLEKLKEAKGKMDKLPKGSKEAANLARRLRNLMNTARQSLDPAAEAVESIGRVSKIATGLKLIGRTTAIAGVAFSAYQVGVSGYETWDKRHIEGRSAITGAKTGLYAANLVADASAVAITFGAQGARFVAGRAALPLVPLTYAGEKIFDTLYEGTLTEAEWAQKHGYDALMHEFFTTSNSVSLGDAWVTGFSSFASFDHGKEIDKSMAEKAVTMHKIFKVLVCSKKNPKIMQTINELSQSDKSSKEKDEAIQGMIDDTYTKYHEYYFQHAALGLIQNHQGAQKAIVEAQLFDDIMQIRDNAKAKGLKEYMFGHVNLLSDRFEITGGKKNPKAERFFLPSSLIDMYKEGTLEAIKNENSPQMIENLDTMETPYLLRLYVQMMLSQNLAPEIQQIFEMNTETIHRYLSCKRDVNVDVAITNPSLHKPKWNLEKIMEHLADFDKEGGSEKYKEFEVKAFNNPSVYAMYKLAQFFGYSGGAKESDLKEFFSENTREQHGVYWDGEGWYVRERGMELDDFVGYKLNAKTISEILTLFREQPDNIFSHRHDTIFADAYEFDSQVGKMERALAGGYTAYHNARGIEVKESISSVPGSFKPWKIDYKKAPEALTLEYRKALREIKNANNWSYLNYEVRDDKTIIMKRHDGDETLTLTRTGEVWKMKNSHAKFNLFQAISMGNLLNKVKQDVIRNDHVGASKKPFELEGNSIDFDENWSPVDWRVLENAVGFYKNIGISKEEIRDTLNNWHAYEYQNTTAKVA